jgi:hypothetical protein
MQPLSFSTKYLRKHISSRMSLWLVYDKGRYSANCRPWIQHVGTIRIVPGRRIPMIATWWGSPRSSSAKFLFSDIFGAIVLYVRADSHVQARTQREGEDSPKANSMLVWQQDETKNRNICFDPLRKGDWTLVQNVCLKQGLQEISNFRMQLTQLVSECSVFWSAIVSPQ